MRLNTPPIYMLAIVTGLSLALVYILLTVTSVSREPDLRSYLTRTAYPAFITGATLVATGRGASLYDGPTQAEVQSEILAPYNYSGGLLPYNHLPFLAVTLSTVALLPLELSYGIWMVATTLALLAALVLLSREIRDGAQTPREGTLAVVALWALALGFFPVYHELSQGQTAAWLLLGYTLTIRALRRNQDREAGLAAVSGLIKPQLAPLPLLVILLERRWRSLAAFAILAGALALLVTPLLGGLGWVPSFTSWLLGMAGGGTGGNVHPVLMENWRGQFTLLAQSIDPQADHAAWILPLTAVATLLYLVLLIWAWLTRPASANSGSASWHLLWAATLLAALLLSPHLLGYELTLWLLPGVLLWRAARQPGGPPPAHAALLLATGYLAGTLSLPLIGGGFVPLHLGALFMAIAIPLLIYWSRRGTDHGLRVT